MNDVLFKEVTANVNEMSFFLHRSFCSNGHLMRRTMKQKECTVNDVGSAIKMLSNTTYRQGFIEKVN